jgi:hypothetical protein
MGARLPAKALRQTSGTSGALKPAKPSACRMPRQGAERRRRVFPRGTGTVGGRRRGLGKKNPGPCRSATGEAIAHVGRTARRPNVGRPLASGGLRDRPRAAKWITIKHTRTFAPPTLSRRWRHKIFLFETQDRNLQCYSLFILLKTLISTLQNGLLFYVTRDEIKPRIRHNFAQMYLFLACSHDQINFL